MIPQEDITAVILAGGQGRRMGGADKGLVEFEGRPLIAHVIGAISDQVQGLLLSVNRNLQRYQQFGYPLVTDAIGNYQGPLAGILSAMQVAQTPYLLTLPCDGPRVPGDLVPRLAHTLEGADTQLAVVHDGERLQSAYALISMQLKQDLEGFLARGERKLGLWQANQHPAQADFSDTPASFININTDEQMRHLQSDAD